MRANALTNKYQIILENNVPAGNTNLSEKLVKLDELLRGSMNSTELGRELFSAFNIIMMISFDILFLVLSFHQSIFPS